MANETATTFLWGASTAAHQVEGDNIYSDSWAMEQLQGSSYKEPSGNAVDHYRLYREDIAWLAEFGLNAYRFSIEWARIEPEEGRYDPAEVRHYRDVLQACRDYRVTPLVTLHHFTSPKWLIRAGGWESEETPFRFARYCRYIMSELGKDIPYVCTINEANIAIGLNKMMERYKSGLAAQVGINMDRTPMQTYEAELERAFGVSAGEIHPFLAPRSERGMKIVFEAHVQARRAIREVSPHTQIGISLSLHDVQWLDGGAEHAAQDVQEEFLQFLPYLREDDYIGVQNYTRSVFDAQGVRPTPEAAERTQMGYEFYPQGLESVIRLVHEHLQMPVIVTENGVATEDDRRRIVFIERAIAGVRACIDDGIPVLGYMYWSLLDNFEWQLGYSKTFGLIEVDRSTQQRLPKPSAYHYGKIAQLDGRE